MQNITDLEESFKFCKGCSNLKSLKNFSIRSKSIDGLQKLCKQCTSEYDRKYREKNKDKRKIKQKEYYIENKESIQDYKHNWHKNNKERLNINATNYYKENQDIIKEYRKKNKETLNLKSKNWKISNKKKVSEYNKFYTETNPEIVKRKNLKRYAAKKNRLLNCDDNVDMLNIIKSCPEGYAIDHIIPLQGKNVSGLHVSWNLQYLTKSENSSKSNKFDGTYNNEGWKSCR